MSHHGKSSHSKIHTLHARSHIIHGVQQVALTIHETDVKHLIYVPGSSEEEGRSFLQSVGSGTLGTGTQDLWLGQTLPWIRHKYYEALKVAEKEIAERKAQLGGKLKDAAEMEKFAQWVTGRRNAIARLWRIPAGPGGLLGGEIRDLRTYGIGGRNLPNLLRRAQVKYGKTGVAAMEQVVASAAKPNPAETMAILRGAKYLKAGGSALFVGGLAITAYDIASAPASERVEVAKREGVETAGGLAASNLAVGVCFLLGMSGVGLVVVGVVAGVAGAMTAQKMYYAHTHSEAFHELHETGFTHVSKLDLTAKPGGH